MTNIGAKTMCLDKLARINLSQLKARKNPYVSRLIKPTTRIKKTRGERLRRAHLGAPISKLRLLLKR